MEEPEGPLVAFKEALISCSGRPDTAEQPAKAIW